MCSRTLTDGVGVDYPDSGSPEDGSPSVTVVELEGGGGGELVQPSAAKQETGEEILWWHLGTG